MTESRLTYEEEMLIKTAKVWRKRLGDPLWQPAWDRRLGDAVDRLLESEA